GAAEVGGEGGDWIISVIPQEVLGEAALLFGNRRVALQLLRVDYRQIEPGLCAMIEKDRVEHFPSRFGQTKGHVADAKNGFDVRNLLFDQANAFDGFDRAADVVRVAGGAGKHERVDDDVFG